MVKELLPASPAVNGAETQRRPPLRAALHVPKSRGHSALRLIRLRSGRLRRSAMNWSNSVLSLAMRRRRGNRGTRAAPPPAAAAFRCDNRQMRGCRSRDATTKRHRRLPPISGAHPVHLALHALHLVLPAVVAVISASHSSAPYGEGEDAKAERPPDHEAEDDQGDPGGFSEFVELGGDWHCRPRVNVNNIYIARPGRRAPVKQARNIQIGEPHGVAPDAASKKVASGSSSCAAGGRASEPRPRR